MNRSMNDKKTHIVALFLTSFHDLLQKRDRVGNNPILVTHSQHVVHLMHQETEGQNQQVNDHSERGDVREETLCDEEGNAFRSEEEEKEREEGTVLKKVEEACCDEKDGTGEREERRDCASVKRGKKKNKESAVKKEKSWKKRGEKSGRKKRRKRMRRRRRMQRRRRRVVEVKEVKEEMEEKKRRMERRGATGSEEKRREKRMAKRHANWSVVYWAKKETRSVKEKREIAKRVLREKKKEVVVMFQKKGVI